MKTHLSKIAKFWGKISGIAIGFTALIWFLIRVIPKPSRASYPCQQAAFPLASAFVIWLTAVISSMFAFKTLGRKLAKHKAAVSIISVVSTVVFIGWFTIMPLGIAE